MPGDDLTQQLADAMLSSAAAALGSGRSANFTDIARAVLASGLVVPASDVLNLAQQREDMAEVPDSAAEWFAAELRALTERNKSS